MEIKYTIEILTKDIQDIEKLVGNLQNSPEGSALELDLALSKLRNVYDILTMIKTDMLLARNQQPSQSVSQAAADPLPQEGNLSGAKEKNEVIQQEPADVENEAIPDTTVREKKETGILAEKFHSESSINENLAGTRAADTESALIGEPIDNISRNIGINDRFLIIRELFNGDGEGFNTLVGNLDSAGNYQEAVKFIEESFSNSLEHEGVGILMGLVKRRYIR